MQWSGHFDPRDFDRRKPDPENSNPSVFWHAALVFGLCVFFASHGPLELFAASLSTLLVFAAITCMIAALLRGEEVPAPRLTHWDAAAVFVLMSILLSWLVDPEAARAYLEAQGVAVVTELS